MRLAISAGNEYLATVIGNSFPGEHAARELDQIALVKGHPCLLVSDNGTALTSNALLAWQQDRLMEWHYIAPGTPLQNGLVEAGEPALIQTFVSHARRFSYISQLTIST